jgi:hypothetical protein
MIATNLSSSSYTFSVITYKTWGGKLATLLTSKRLLWLIMGLGVALRFAQYLANRSLWLDEAFLALNVVQRSFSQLFQPLDDEQVAPIAYLLAENLLTRTH